MIDFSCIECKGTSSTFNERLGEMICDDCGLVQLTNPFEETVSARINSDKSSSFDNRRYSKDTSLTLGSFIDRQDVRNKMGATLRRENIRTTKVSSTDRYIYTLTYNILWKYNVQDKLKDRVATYYKSLKKHRVIEGSSIEQRAASLSYFILKEANIYVKLSNHSKITNVPTSKIVKYSKKIATHFRKSHVFISTSPINDIQNILDLLYEFNLSPSFRNDVIILGEHVSVIYSYNGTRFSDNVIASIVWLVSRMRGVKLSQVQILNKVGGCEVTLRKCAYMVCDVLNIDRKNLEYYNAEEIVKGIRHG